MNLLQARRNAGLCMDCGSGALPDESVTVEEAERRSALTLKPVARLMSKARCSGCWHRHSNAISQAAKRRRDRKVRSREEHRRLYQELVG